MRLKLSIEIEFFHTSKKEKCSNQAILKLNWDERFMSLYLEFEYAKFRWFWTIKWVEKGDMHFGTFLMDSYDSITSWKRYWERERGF